MEKYLRVANSEFGHKMFCLGLVKTIIYACFFTIFLYYLLYVEINVECWADDSYSPIILNANDERPIQGVDVSHEFQILFVLFTVATSMDVFRGILEIIYHYTGSRAVGTIKNLFLLCYAF